MKPIFLTAMLFILSSCSVGLEMNTEQGNNQQPFNGSITLGNTVEFESRSEHYTMKTFFPIAASTGTLSENYSAGVPNEK